MSYSSSRCLLPMINPHIRTIINTVCNFLPSEFQSAKEEWTGSGLKHPGSVPISLERKNFMLLNMQNIHWIVLGINRSNLIWKRVCFLKRELKATSKMKTNPSLSELWSRKHKSIQIQTKTMGLTKKNKDYCRICVFNAKRGKSLKWRCSIACKSGCSVAHSAGPGQSSRTLLQFWSCSVRKGEAKRTEQSSRSGQYGWKMHQYISVSY